MPMSFDQFILSSRCPKLILSDEDQPQDVNDWRKLEKAHQEKLYQRYLNQFEPDVAQQESPVAKHVALQSEGANKSRAEYFRLYRKLKRCRHCGKINP